MEQESYWNDLKNALALKTSMEEAEKLIGTDKDISSKQEELKNILTIFEVDKTLFQSLEIELDSEDEDENLASLNALMRTETEKVSVQAESNLEKLVGKNVDEHVDVKAVLHLLTVTTAMTRKETELKAAKDEDPDDEGTIKTLAVEQEQCQEELTKATKILKKAKTNKRIRDCHKKLVKSTIPSTEKRTTSRSRSPSAKKQRIEKEEESVGGSVTPQEVIDGMLEDVTVTVKLLYCASAISESTSKYTDKLWKTYEATVGANDKEYTLIGQGEDAAFVQAELADFEKDAIVTITNIKYYYHQYEAKLQMTQSSKVMQCDDEKLVKLMEKQTVKRCSLKDILAARDQNRRRFNLQMCCVNTLSELKHDKNGKPFRSTRIVDAESNVTNMMVWGELAAKDVWKKDDVVYIYGAETNYESNRLDVRPSSYVELTDKAKFPKTPKMQFLKWN